jgi:type VI secretion system protein ImpL
MKRVLIGILIFIVFMALVVGAALLLHFEGTKLILFIAILGLIGLLALVLILWLMHKAAAAAGGASGSGGPDTPDSINLNILLRDADAKIRQTGRAGAKSLASLPLIYVMGDENSAKTQTVLQSGLDPELLAGNVYQDGYIVPTQLANLWLAGNYVIAEAGGALLRQPSLWVRLVRATIPARLGSIFGDSRLPARSVVVCVSIERILAPNTSEQIRALAQTLNERLRQLSQTLGIVLPVYVLFTKLDTVAPFAEYATRLTDEEVKLPIGTLLSSLSSGTGLYTEQATTLIAGKFDQLVYALSEFRLDVLARGGELKDLARAYEFPRDLRKLRAGLVGFLAEVARPSQIGVNPFLRGFFFTGMRAHLVEDVLDIGPAQTQPAAAPVDAGATRVFSLAAAQPQAPTPQPRRGGQRKVPQWVFLPHLFSNILLADKSALEISRASTRTSVLKRTLLACVSALILIALALITISFFKNRALENRVAEAAAAHVSQVGQGSFAAIGDLQSLDSLRAVLAELDGYRKNGPPFMDRFGLYKGDALYPVACQAYAGKFRTLLLSPTQANIAAKLGALPAASTPDSDYGAAYHPLKAYLITATNPDPDTPPDTVDFLPSELLTDWTGNATPDPEVSRLAQAQFAFYANLLPGPNSCLAAAGSPRNEALVARTRVYLNSFQGFQHIYQSMLAAADRKVPGFNFNGKFPGSATYIVDTYPIHGAFTHDGFPFMQDAILHPDQYSSGEPWVLGPSTGPPIDRSALAMQLKQAYTSDYLQAWQNYLKKAQFIGYRTFAEAGVKLGALDSNTSALLELFSLVSTNTAVSDTNISKAFQAPQAIVAPATSPDARLIGSTNQAYIQALQNLEGAIKSLTSNPATANDPAAAAPVAQAAIAAEGAAETLRNGFVPDPVAGMDKITFTLLEDPIESSKALAAGQSGKAAGGGAAVFCDQLKPLLGQFPFNPTSQTDAPIDQVAAVFAPNGTFSAFLATPAIKGVVMQTGTTFAAAPGSTIKMNPAFLNFLSNAQKISSALFPSGTQPSLDFTLAEVKSPPATDATLTIDGKQLKGAGQSSSFHWIAQPSSTITIVTQKNTGQPITGPWSIFHFAYGNAQPQPNRLKFTFSFNNQISETEFFDASGSGAALLNPDFMRSFHCVPNPGH